MKNIDEELPKNKELYKKFGNYYVKATSLEGKKDLLDKLLTETEIENNKLKKINLEKRKFKNILF